MSRKKKIFITVGIVFNILLGTGIYLNYEMNKVVDKMNTVLLKDNKTEISSDITGTENNSLNPAPEVLDWRNPNTNNNGENSEKPGNTPSTTPSTTEIIQELGDKLNQPIEKTDLLKAGMIVLSKLDSAEINYLYQIGNKDKRTAEEIEQAKKILQNKLTPKDIDTLYNMGLKYGKKLSFLKQ